MTMAHSSCSVVLLSSALYTYKTPFLPLFISPHLIPSPMEFRTRPAFNLDDDTSSKRKNGSSSGATKRGSPGSGGVAPPSCQADSCPAVLTDAKRYHRRHKVCEFHSKSPVVIVSGLRQRFCQQCSRFHELSEFDDAKRSCRRRLAGHNERRRKSTSAEPGEGKVGSSSSSSSSSQIQCRIISSDENSNRVQAIRVRDRPSIFKLDEDLN